MRKLVFGINLTIDGCCDHTKGIPDEEVHDYFTRLTREADVLVYGRKTYQLMVPFWPDIAQSPTGDKAMDDFARAFASVPQIVVFSQTLNPSNGTNTKIVRDNLQDEIRKLKAENGKSILTGGVALPTQLIESGLVDEIHVVVHPVIAGKGRRLFEDMESLEQLKFNLFESNTFKSGCIALHFIKQ